jgi:hypothetical protein
MSGMQVRKSFWYTFRGALGSLASTPTIEVDTIFAMSADRRLFRLFQRNLPFQLTVEHQGVAWYVRNTSKFRYATLADCEAERQQVRKIQCKLVQQKADDFIESVRRRTQEPRDE